MDPQDPTQNPVDDTGQPGSMPADDGKPADGGQAGDEQPAEGEGEIAPPPPAAEVPSEPDASADGSEAPSDENAAA